VVAAYVGTPAPGAIGVLAGVDAVARLGDSALVLTLVGRRRVTYAPADSGGSRLARVSAGERAGTGADAARSDVLAAARRYRAALAEFGYPSNVLAAVPEDPIDASYRLASVLRISEPERQHVLESPTAAERLGLLATVFARERVLLEATISAGGR
jgi:Lon protease-like protein